MIKLTLLGTQKQVLYINPHQIEYIEPGNHSQTLVMLSGKRLQVLEDLQTIGGKIINYRRKIGIFKNEE